MYPNERKKEEEKKRREEEKKRREEEKKRREEGKSDVIPFLISFFSL